MPWKVQIISLRAAQLAKQGLVGQTLAFINDSREKQLKCVFMAAPEEADRPWVINLLLTPSELRSCLRVLTFSNACKSPVGYPELGVRAARCTPGPLLPQSSGGAVERGEEARARAVQAASNAALSGVQAPWQMMTDVGKKESRVTFRIVGSIGFVYCVSRN